MSSLRIGIAGGGVGGLTAAIALRRGGHDAVVFEQAKQFGRVGADINLTPNAARALMGLGLLDACLETAAQPTHRLSRTWDTGEETSRLPMGDTAREKYGAPQITMHRADVVKVLTDALPAEALRLDKRVTGVEEAGDHVTVTLADGTRESVDVLIGADGIHSVVRAYLHGPDRPRFTGMVCFRGVFPSERVEGLAGIDTFTKWWGPNPQTQLVHFPLAAGREIFIFATTAQDSWLEESWTKEGDIAELRALYAGFHPDARRLLDAGDTVLKQALFDRDPLPWWSRGSITLLGDACHPMLPYMAQGACMAIEDAIVLGRKLQGVGKSEEPAALKAYEAARLERTARIQLASRENNWLRSGSNGDWLYAYDAWSTA